jgi:hypothetical protein
MGQLAALTDLSLVVNRLSSTLPTQLARLSKLQYLLMWRNALTGPIPSELGKLSALLGLGLSSNLLNFTIPTDFGRLTNLQYLRLGGNRLTGSVQTKSVVSNAPWESSFGSTVRKWVSVATASALRTLRIIPYTAIELETSDNVDESEHLH